MGAIDGREKQGEPLGVFQRRMTGGEQGGLRRLRHKDDFCMGFAALHQLDRGDHIGVKLTAEVEHEQSGLPAKKALAISVFQSLRDAVEARHRLRRKRSLGQRFPAIA